MKNKVIIIELNVTVQEARLTKKNSQIASCLGVAHGDVVADWSYTNQSRQVQSALISILRNV